MGRCLGPPWRRRNKGRCLGGKEGYGLVRDKPGVMTLLAMVLGVLHRFLVPGSTCLEGIACPPSRACLAAPPTCWGPVARTSSVSRSLA